MLFLVWLVKIFDLSKWFLLKVEQNKIFLCLLTHIDYLITMLLIMKITTPFQLLFLERLS